MIKIKHPPFFFSTFAHVKTLKILFSFFLLCLSYFPSLHPFRGATFQTQRPFLEVPRRAALSAGASVQRVAK